MVNLNELKGIDFSTKYYDPQKFAIKNETFEFYSELDLGWGRLDCEFKSNSSGGFLTLCKTIDRGNGVFDLLDWLEETDFYTAPASTKYHGAHQGGLLEHSLNVYDELKRLLSAYPEIKVSEESVVIVALFHDLCKVNFYATEKRNRKNESGQWESYDAYTIQEKFCFGGHGSKSVYLVQHFMSLKPEEAVAINCHMASWDGNKDVGKAFEKFPLAWLLHVADESATFIKESKEDT